MKAPVSAPARSWPRWPNPNAKQPDVLVLDLRDQTHLPAALPLLKRQHPTTGVIIVTVKMDPALLLEAMRIGVTEVVTNVTEEDLKAAIGRLMALRPAPSVAGKAYAFLGAKGGVGTTTVAVNVATALSKLEPGSTLLVDLHVANGDAAVFLGVEPRFSIVDALENTHRLDEAFFSNLVVHAKSGVDLLASSDRVMVTPVDVRRIRTILEFAERHYKYIVLDVPRSDADGARRARERVAHRGRREPGAGDGPQRQPDRRRAAAALRQGQAARSWSAAPIAWRTSATRTSSAPSASTVKHSFPERLPPGAAGPE